MAESEESANSVTRRTERLTPGQRTAVRFARRGAVVLVSVLILTFTAVGWVALDRSANTSKVLQDSPPSQPRDDGALDILLVGSDSRTDAQGDPLPLSVLKELRTESTSGLNTDTLILMRVPHGGGTPTAVSIPRDTEVSVAGNGKQKINGVYGRTMSQAADKLAGSGASDVERESALAGQRALVRAVQELTGVRLDHYAEVNLLGFYEVTKAVGGVEVCLNQSTSDKDSGADFAAGRQVVSGGDALAFVRQRHGLPRGDLDRVVRQQVFLAGLANKVLSTGTLTDPARLNSLIDAAHRSVTLDEGWNMGEFVQRMQELAGGAVRFETLPIEEDSARNAQGQFVVRVDPVTVRGFVASLVTKGFAAEPRLSLDGAAHRQPITSDGIPCVN